MLSKSEKLALLKSRLSPPVDFLPDCRLSEPQHRLWALEERLPSHPVHVFAIVYYLHGPLDSESLAAAIQAVATRHKALRVRIAVDFDGQPYFKDVQPPVLEQRVYEGDLGRALRAEAAIPIDPATGPGWRCVLFRNAPDSNALLLKFHHIFADRWSVGIFIADLGKAWINLQSGLGAGLPPLDSPRVDPRIASAAREQISWWKSSFTRPPAPLALPGAHPAERLVDYGGARLEFVIERHIVARLKDLGSANSTTLFPLALAAFTATLYRHTAQQDMILCTPMTGRHRAGNRGVIGYFNNVVPVRLDLSGDPSFIAFACRTGNIAREVYAHQDVPFESVAGLPELSATSLTRCMVALQNIPGLQLDLPSLDTRYEDVSNGTANFDLALFLEEKEGRIEALLDYKTSIYEAPTADLLRQRFVEILELVAQNPELRLSALPRYSFGETPGVTSRPPVTVTAGHSAAVNLLEQRMVEIWRKLFPCQQVDADSNFFELGGDSLRAARLFAAVEREFGHQLPLAALLEAKTSRELVNKMCDEDWVAPWLALIPVQAEGSRPPLFCVHGGGGNVLSFRFLAECLGNDQPVYCLQEQSSKPDGPVLTTVEEMADYYIESVRRLRPRGPYMLAGHSLGAAVAYEMAQRLTAQGERVAFLGVLDHPGPNIRITLLDWIRSHMMNVSMLQPRDRLEYIWRGLAWRSNSRRARKRMAASSVPADQEAINSHWNSLDLIEQALRALRAYQIKPWSGRVTVFRAHQGSPAIRSDALGGWGGLAAQGVEVHDVPGTHMTMFEQPHVRKLGTVMRECLEQLDLAT